MPFDDPTKRVEIPLKNPEEIAIIDQTLVTLRNPKHWCQGLYFQDTAPRFFRTSNRAYCLVGALSMADNGRPDGLRSRSFNRDASRQVWLRLRVLVGTDIEDYNDDPAVGHSDILALLRRARATFE